MSLNKSFLRSFNFMLNVSRSICNSGVKYQEKTDDDPVQKLFLEKLREYKELSKDGKMVDPTPEIEKELQSELERVNKQHGGDGKTDLSAFPEFKFPEVQLDPIENKD